MHEFESEVDFVFSDISSNIEMYKGKKAPGPKPEVKGKSNKGQIEKKSGGKTNPSIKVG